MGIVTLVSGGMDSTLMSLLAKEEGIEALPLFVDYGQLGAKREWSTCQRLHKRLGLPVPHRMDLAGFGTSVPSGITNNEMDIDADAFLPGRNLLLILGAASFAYARGCVAVAIGLLASRTCIFPDQTDGFLSLAETMIEEALGRRIAVLVPLRSFSKKDVIDRLIVRGVTGTYSCHSGKEHPCGICVACQEIESSIGGD